jgi:hypothetical protein
VNDELERIWKEAIMDEFQGTISTLAGGTEEIQEKLQSG